MLKNDKKILITGGAGFIGQRLSQALLAKDFQVRILDSFNPQIHTDQSLPADLAGRVELIKADVRDRDSMKRALDDVNGIVHLAAETGTGQSMYEIDRYFDVNVQGTATMLDLLQNEDCTKSLRSIVVASSRAVYGEGAYRCTKNGKVFPVQRSRERMSGGLFEPICPECGGPVHMMPTQESAPFNPMSMYGLTKQVQEQAVLLFARTHGINGFGLRYQNVYGPGQSLKNPYTGILAVFSNLARQNQSIEIYEDGLESRDFVYIDDVVEATVRSIEYTGPFIGALNVGSGEATSVATVAQEIKEFFGSVSSIGVSGAFRMGDIRHNIADVSELQRVLDFVPAVPFKKGLTHFLNWAAAQAPEDKAAYLRSVSELAAKGLMGTASTAADERA
ncbi:NAD-dependent epimerase/dehydratase family protein [Polaromonas glacialis]|uniref:NAD-dependent epimerase/dehydratase family protein n=1 Tax=Polaromonas glacialis TaxID=866564 RepID=UPI0004968C40|nr:SDR family NAD(P)-dependent oxidoreductase [Polaromonas glacialis]